MILAAAATVPRYPPLWGKGSKQNRRDPLLLGEGSRTAVSFRRAGLDKLMIKIKTARRKFTKDHGWSNALTFTTNS
jgi:hypothetical protein